MLVLFVGINGCLIVEVQKCIIELQTGQFAIDANLKQPCEERCQQSQDCSLSRVRLL